MTQWSKSDVNFPIVAFKHNLVIELDKGKMSNVSQFLYLYKSYYGFSFTKAGPAQLVQLVRFWPDQYFGKVEISIY